MINKHACPTSSYIQQWTVGIPCAQLETLHDSAPYVQSVHEHWCSNTSNAQSFVWVNACFFSQINIPLFYSFFLSATIFFCFWVYLCARACIWHLSGGLRVMPWSCRRTRPLLHARSEMPSVKLHPSACHSVRQETIQCINRLLSADPCLPQNHQAVVRPLHSSYVTIKIQQQPNTFFFSKHWVTTQCFIKQTVLETMQD